MDKMVSAYKNAVQNNYANFSGRLSLPGYWWFFLANFLIGLVFNVVGRGVAIIGLLGLIYSLAVLIPGLAAAARRLHDTGKSGWLLLLALIPIIGWIILIVFLASAGDTAQNSYGPPPPPGA